jgi:hypothetical protein
VNKLPITSGVQEFHLEDWRQFNDLVIDEFIESPAYVFRGQTDFEWPVLSSLDRHELKYPQRKNRDGGNPEFFDSPPLSEVEHLNAFRRVIRGRRGPNSVPLNDDECWALGQHYGLVTPLLDWTRSPYVALFFAMEEEVRAGSDKLLEPPEYRVVYGLSTSVIEEGAIAGDNNVARLVSPLADDNPRLVSQSGLFLRMPRKVDLETYVRRRFADDQHRAVLVKIKIQNANRDACLVALNKMNINHATLFPDLNGSARFVNSLWQPGHEDSIAYI